MAKLTISEASRVTGASRMLLYRYVKTGKLSRTPDGLLDTTELLRVGLSLQSSDVTPLHEVTSPPAPVVTPPVTPDVTTMDCLVRRLEREIDEAHAREQQYQDQIARLTLLVEQLTHRSDRLLEAPRSTPSPVPPAPTPATSPPRGEIA